MDKLIEHIKSEEGYRSRVYKCTENYDTIGYGFAIKDLELSERVCDLILKEKLVDLYDGVNRKFPFFERLPIEAQDIVLGMAYQMGVTGVSKFRKMLAALKMNDFKTAAEEMLDSRWSKQTPNRANRMAEKMRSIDG
tara:strand:- start:6250 stop:6660 length:411 start_codon:yes stop_codon:yes gene_type:complete